MKNNYLYILLTITLIYSCSSGPDRPVNNPLFDDGYFVTNEGNFGSGNGSVSFVSNNGSVQNDVFYNTNMFYLGDVVQSMTTANNKGYIVVNNSGKVEVVDMDSMNHIKTIENVGSPRYFTQVSQDKAYLSDWNSNAVHIIDLTTDNVIGTISVGAGPESITVANNKAYVCNVGGWGLENTVSVIDISSDQVVLTINVNDKPNSAVVDATGNLWVLSGGYTEYDASWNIVNETAGALTNIDTYTDNVISNLEFPIGQHPKNLVSNRNGDKLYYLNGTIYTFSTSSASLDSIPFVNKYFYGLGCDGFNVYGTDAMDYVQSGWSYKYDRYGNALDSNQVGIIPGGYCFN